MASPVFSWERILLGLVRGSLVFHRDLAEGSCLASHDPPSPPLSPLTASHNRWLPYKTQRARSTASWPVSGQGQGHRIPAPPPGNAPPCTARIPPAAGSPPASYGHHPERETGVYADLSLDRACSSLGIFPFRGITAGPGVAAGAGLPLASPGEGQLPAAR